MEATQMSINRWMDKEGAVDVYNGILLCHKKEWNSAIYNDVYGPRVYYASEISQTEKDKYCVITYMWNIKNK